MILKLVLVQYIYLLTKEVHFYHLDFAIIKYTSTKMEVMDLRLLWWRFFANIKVLIS